VTAANLIEVDISRVKYGCWKGQIVEGLQIEKGEIQPRFFARSRTQVLQQIQDQFPVAQVLQV